MDGVDKLPERIVFIGGILDEKYKKDILATLKNFLPNSADIFQKNLLNGLLENGISSLTVINSLHVGSFPRYCNMLKIKNRATYYDNHQNIELIDTGFVNLPIVGKDSRFRSTKKAINQKFSVDDNILFIVYSLLPQNAKIISYLKKKYPNSRIMLIITDFPQYMVMNIEKQYSISGIYHSIDNSLNKRLFDNCYEAVDYYVLLSPYMQELIPGIDSKKVLILDGILDVSLFDRIRSNVSDDGQQEKKRIVYTGALEAELGLTDLVEAFNKLQKDSCVLQIAGDGTYKEWVIEKTVLNPNIEYLGSLQKSDAVKLQLEADILVCPTRMNIGAAKYAFPAKLLEYLYTGNIVVSNRLPCISDDYYPYITFTDGNTVDDLANTLASCLQKENCVDLDQIEWIRNHRSSKGQARRIIDFAGK